MRKHLARIQVLGAILQNSAPGICKGKRMGAERLH
jgi:hypothetical protein